MAKNIFENIDENQKKVDDFLKKKENLEKTLNSRAPDFSKMFANATLISIPTTDLKTIDEPTPVREICEQYGLTQRALADRFGIPLRTVEQWCTGKRKCPDYTVRMIRTILEYEQKE